MNNKLPYIITRPQAQGVQLQQTLAQAGINAVCQPLFHYQAATEQIAIEKLLNQFAPAVIVFVSVAAVNFAHQAYPLNQWIDKDITVIAVGSATQNALAALGLKAISPQRHDSEGMLALAALSAEQLTNNNKILIVRGDSGRELLSSQLTARGANVRYLESYRRMWSDLSASSIKTWHSKKLAGVIITSNALLERVVNLIDISDNFWQNTCLWLVASERIKQNAEQLGIKNLINCHGASDQAITTTLLNMESKR